MIKKIEVKDLKMNDREKGAYLTSALRRKN